MSPIQEWKQERVSEIMSLLDKAYRPETAAYRNVEATLGKLSMKALSDMYVMILTSVK